jgi:hypothetical protein
MCSLLPRRWQGRGIRHGDERVLSAADLRSSLLAWWSRYCGDGGWEQLGRSAGMIDRYPGEGRRNADGRVSRSQRREKETARNGYGNVAGPTLSLCCSPRRKSRTEADYPPRWAELGDERGCDMPRYFCKRDEVELKVFDQVKAVRLEEEGRRAVNLGRLQGDRSYDLGLWWSRWLVSGPDQVVTLGNPGWTPHHIRVPSVSPESRQMCNGKATAIMQGRSSNQ